MKQYSEEILIKVQRELDLNCPSPESILSRLCRCVATLAASEESAKLRHLVLDIDDLTAQTRWHLGQALLLLETQPEILTAGENDDPMIKGAGVPTGAQLLLRDYIVKADRVLYEDLSTPRRGGTVGGWIFHMMIDGAVYRTVSALDRLAALLWSAADLPVDRIYFRSGKVEKLHAAIRSDDSARLLQIAEGKLLTFIVDYRDGLTHSTKAYSRASGHPPSELWKDKNGHLVVWDDNSWNAETLFALGRASYLQLVEALEPSTRICEKKWPPESK